MEEEERQAIDQFAKSLVVSCFRNTYLEDIHCGTFPSSKTGDYTDVKVVSPYGEISWNEVSRISNAEMKKLMKQAVNYVFTYMLHQKEKGILETFLKFGKAYTFEWDEAEIDKDFLKGLRSDYFKSSE